MKGKFFTLLFLLGIVPILAVGGIGLYVLLTGAPSAPAPVRSAPLAPPDLGADLTKVQQVVEAFLKANQTAAGDIASIATKSSEADFQSYATAHPGVSDVFLVSPAGAPMLAYPANANPVDASYAASEEFQNILKRAADGAAHWPFQFYSRRNNRPSFVFIEKAESGGYVGVDLEIESFLKPLAAAGGDAALVDAESGKVYGATRPDLLDSPLNVNNDSLLVSALQDLKTKQAGTKSNQDQAVVFAPLNVGNFGLVHLIPLRAAALAAARAPAAEGLTLDKVLKNPELLAGNLLFLVLIGAFGWILLIGFILLMGFLKPLKSALQVLEAASAGQGKISEEAIRKVGAPEVSALLTVSARWAERLEREKESLGQQKDDEIRKAMAQLQQRNQELVEAGKKYGDAKADGDQKAQQLADKLKEMDALKGMSDGLRTQAEQARGEIAKLKALMSNQDSEAKKIESDLKQKIQQQADEAVAQVRELESKLLQVVAAASSINVSKVRVAAIKTMAEELKTTLGIIKGYVSSALGSPQSGITEKQQEFLGMVINRSARLEKFINDLVDIYQVEIEQDDAQRDPASLASEIEGLAFNFQPQADIKGIKIKVEEKGTPAKVPIVRRRFTQLWNILYLQIIKDAPRNAQVTIVVEPVGQDVKVTVLDPGLIVKPEYLSKLFDDFYDPKHPASPQLAGTGLKFALIKTILSAHGGVALAEKADPGTRLLLTFPSQYKKKENPAEAILASVRKAVPPVTGGLLGAVKPGTMAPSAVPVKPPMTPASPASTVKPPVPGALDAFLGGSKPAGPSPGFPKPPVPGVPQPPPGPKPAVPGPPPSTTPKPPIPAGGLDALLGGGPKPPVAVPPPMAGPSPAVKPPVPGAPSLPVPPPAVRPQVPGAGLDALFSSKPPVPGAVPGAVPAPAPVKPPTPAKGIPTAPTTPPPPPPVTAVKPPVPPVPGAIHSVPPPPGAVKPGIPPPPGPAVPPPFPIAGIPPAPKIVPTAMKQAPPPGILDLDNQDGFKTDAAKPAVPKPPAAAPPPAPKPPQGLGSSSPIVKDLEKDSGNGSGDLIE